MDRGNSSPEATVTALADLSHDASFGHIVASVERIGANQGLPSVIALYRGWIDAQPDHQPLLHAAWFNLGVELSRAKQGVDAAEAYRASLRLKPDFHPAAINLGLLLEQHGQTDSALSVWRGATQSDEARTGLLNHQARLMERMGRLAEAERLLRASLATDPVQPDAVQHWVHLRQKLCIWPVLAPVIPGLAAADMLRQAGPLAVLALTDRVEQQKAISADWIARKTSATPERLSPLGGYRHDRIRIGYISSDFCRHAMSYLIAELFERHDRARFEIFGYCSSPDDGSDLRRRVIGAFDCHRAIRDLPDEAAARLIRADEIDILIDLNGLTAGARLQVLRWHPAPVQATYLGFIGPVPLPELDYLLCDGFVVPPALDAAYAPKPLRIVGNYQANDSKRVIGAPMTRAMADLPADRFVFCCFSNHYKITQPMFAAWMDILRQTGDSVLWLVADNPWSCENLRRAAQAAGVDPGRLLFADRTDPAHYMARLSLPDLFLDTFPYNAGTIASDAIRMGLPLLTLCGESYASRMAASLLNTLGASGGIAHEVAEYTRLAVDLANDPAAMTTFRQAFTPERWAATIGDIAAFASAYEAALLSVSRTPA